MTNLAIGLVEVQKVPPDRLFWYEGLIFRFLYSDDLYSYCSCLSDRGIYLFFNYTLVNLIESEEFENV